MRVGACAVGERGNDLLCKGDCFFLGRRSSILKEGSGPGEGGVATPGRENRLRGILRTGPLSVAVSRFVCEILGVEGRERVLLA